ncbi:aldose 1-epimerase family protein [Paenarthrobacter ilicis]|uniref:aldose 1-epimerase family protein n=1 Tax=Paenarthrobacter ilicis TaxID=43665 RepID=UPI0028D19252|nr:aldose 1-epimerase family protein [Paenarthrobacter ilicis]
MSGQIELSAYGRRVVVAVRGAEMQSLIGPDGHEYLWQAGRVWPRHAPVLFPAICRHPDDLLKTKGQEYPLRHHGFARDLDFKVTDKGSSHAAFSLEDTPGTRQQYPFRFRLDINYHLDKAGVLITFRVHNPGPDAIPYGIGSHPAFNWPLEPGMAPDKHVIVFDRPEKVAIRRTHDNLLLPESFTEISLAGGQMKLSLERFHRGAVILEKIRSSSLQYRCSSGRAVHLSWNGFQELALWSPDQGGFLCIEPWRGLPAPRDWAGDEEDRADLEHLPPNETRTYAYRIDIETP